jgi:hypothetical protein
VGNCAYVTPAPLTRLEVLPITSRSVVSIIQICNETVEYLTGYRLVVVYV